MLLIDELDKSDIDLPNELIHVLENGAYDIPELVRARHQEGTVLLFIDDPDGTAPVTNGLVRCRDFPFDRAAPARDASRPRLLPYRSHRPLPLVHARKDPTVPTRQTARITAVVIVVLLAVIAALGTGIVTAHLGASALTAVTAGGAAFLGIGGLGTAIATFLLSPPSSSSPC
ncbi:hypothetical protein ACFTZM_37015 [Streptomyces hydrogenans]|uniref:hypothetical protein n=1 Tax=Streptomyces hydrogenans TaxID=1873719 RepID=UPI003635E936